MQNTPLKKEISAFSAFSTVMGTVIGAGVFFKAAAVVAQTHSGGWTLLVWALAGFLTICGGLTVAELATAIPETGGPVKYLERTYGKLPAFLFGWACSIIYFPANIAALSIIFATQLIHLFQFPDSWLLMISIVTAASVTGINILGTKVASKVQSTTLIIKLLPIALIILFGLLQPAHGISNIFSFTSRNQHGLLAGISGALLATLFAYDGWLNVGNIAGEMKRPEKDLPRAIILGLSFVTLVYFLVNLVFLKTLSIPQIAGNSNAASDAATIIFGRFGGKIVTMGILISVYGALNGYTMTGLRVPYTLACENTLPFSHYLKKVSPKFSSPYIAALFQLVIACVMMLLGTFDLLTDMLVFVMWLFSILIFAAVFILRIKQPELVRPYRVPFYPLPPLIAIIGGGFILVMTIINSPKLALTGIFITLLGVPVYYLGKKNQEKETAKEDLNHYSESS